MSTIASPRRPPLGTPDSSARPSLDASRSSAVTSPVNNSNPSSGLGVTSLSSAGAAGGGKRSNRAALREYYNLKAAAAAAGATASPSTPRIEVAESEVPVSDFDQPDFDANEYVKKVTADSGIEELLRLYTKIVGEVRALDAEKKALVYDNYSKLIAATETIRKMRATMDPLNPMASTLDPAIAQIYSKASSIRDDLRRSIPAPDSEEGKRRAAEAQQRRTRELAAEVLSMPERLRALVRDGKVDEAKRQWQMPRRLLETWKQKGVGGDDVQACIDEGDAAMQSPSGGDVSRQAREKK